MTEREAYKLIESIDSLSDNIEKLSKLIGEAPHTYGSDTSLTGAIYELAVKVKRANPISKQIYTDIVNKKKNY